MVLYHGTPYFVDLVGTRPRIRKRFDLFSVLHFRVRQARQVSAFVLFGGTCEIGITGAARVT